MIKEINMIENYKKTPPEKPVSMPTQAIQPLSLKKIWWMLRHKDRLKKQTQWFDKEYMYAMRKRRYLLLMLVVITTMLATIKWMEYMPSNLSIVSEFIVVTLFVLTFGWIAIYFYASLLGVIHTLFYKEDTKSISILLKDIKTKKIDINKLGKTAILMPVYNEDILKVLARILAISEDLIKENIASIYDIYILSDTTNKEILKQEEEMWLKAKQLIEPNINLYYRHRIKNTARKSGNIEDFLKRWGSLYDYMLVLDADSLMTANTIYKMTYMMAKTPHAGIIQAPPQMINAKSTFSRMQQFSGALVGPVVSYGLSFWQGGNSNYWGHNAIIRTKAFIESCGLPKLKGDGPFGGFILSHDFVEAALIARRGWSAWLVPNLKGSYEECPPSIIDFAIRDRRWCQGNLQHIKVLFSRNLNPISRIHFITGIMSYLSSPLWLLFLISGLLMVVSKIIFPPVYFGQTYSLFPSWPIFDKYGTITLFVISMLMLILPKFFGLILYIKNNGKKYIFNGLKSIFAEIILSTLVAPIMMIFQSKFVFDILRGKSVGWNAQNRDEGTSWKTAWNVHKNHLLLGLITWILVYKYANSLFWWISPVTIGLILSMPISVFTSKTNIGLWLKKHNYFTIKEENQVPLIITNTLKWEEKLNSLL